MLCYHRTRSADTKSLKPEPLKCELQVVTPSLLLLFVHCHQYHHHYHQSLLLPSPSIPTTLYIPKAPTSAAPKATQLKLLVLAAPVNGVLVGVGEVPEGVPATSVKFAHVKRVVFEV